MKDIKIISFEEAENYIRMPMDAWTRVCSVPKEEYMEAIRREMYWPEGFLESLKGKTLEEQMACYRIVEREAYSRTAYGEITNTNCHEFGYALEEYPGLNALIVDHGILIGVCIDAFGVNPYLNPLGSAAFPYQDICTYYASDNNGSGSKDREDYAHLCCVKGE